MSNNTIAIPNKNLSIQIILNASKATKPMAIRRYRWRLLYLHFLRRHRIANQEGGYVRMKDTRLFTF